MLTFTYMQPELCSTTTPADCVAPLGACTQVRTHQIANDAAKPFTLYFGHLLEASHLLHSWLNMLLLL